MDKPSITLSIVLPAYNEADNLEPMIRHLRPILMDLDLNHEIIMVDDGSGDDTWLEMTRLGKGDPHLRAIRFSRHFGKEAAIQAGLAHSRGDAVIVMDADLQHPPELIPEMVRLWRQERCQVVHCVKSRRQPESRLRRVPALVFYRLMNLLSGYDLSGASDFKLLERKVVDQYLALPEKVRFFRGLIPWLGYRSASLSFTPTDRHCGRSRWPTFSLVRLGVRAICSFSTIPMQMVTGLGALTFVIAVILSIQALYMKWSGRALEGFTTVIILLLAIGSVLMVSFGIIGEYLALIYEEIKGRPPFVIDRTINIENRSGNTR